MGKVEVWVLRDPREKEHAKNKKPGKGRIRGDEMELDLPVLVFMDGMHEVTESNVEYVREFLSEINRIKDNTRWT
jgi:hypothetical protein